MLLRVLGCCACGFIAPGNLGFGSPEGCFQACLYPDSMIPNFPDRREIAPRLAKGCHFLLCRARLISRLMDVGCRVEHWLGRGPEDLEISTVHVGWGMVLENDPAQFP